MCLSRVYQDIKTAIWNPPKGPLDREILHARLRAYWVRVQYITWNIIATVLLYTFGDSMLNLYINDGEYYYNITFHGIQLIAIIAYFITSFRNPGYVEKIESTQFTMDSFGNDLQNEYKINIKSMDNDDEIINENDFKYLDMNIDFAINGVNNNNDNNNNENNKNDYYSNYPYEIVRYVPEYSHHITIDPDAAPTNFCWRCKFIRPIRSKHCYDCDRCVGKFDHHCPMVGNCVAGNNHRFFVLFMSAQTISVLWAFYIILNSLFEMEAIFNTNNDELSFSDLIITYIFCITLEPHYIGLFQFECARIFTLYFHVNIQKL